MRQAISTDVRTGTSRDQDDTPQEYLVGLLGDFEDFEFEIEELEPPKLAPRDAILTILSGAA